MMGGAQSWDESTTVDAIQNLLMPSRPTKGLMGGVGDPKRSQFIGVYKLA